MPLQRFSNDSPTICVAVQCDSTANSISVTEMSLIEISQKKGLRADRSKSFGCNAQERT